MEDKDDRKGYMLLSNLYSDLKIKYAILQNSAPDAIKNQRKVEVLTNKLSICNEYVKELEDTINKKNGELALLKEQMKGKCIETPIEGAVILAIDGKAIGNYVPQATHLRAIEKLKKLINQE